MRNHREASATGVDGDGGGGGSPGKRTLTASVQRRAAPAPSGGPSPAPVQLSLAEPFGFALGDAEIQAAAADGTRGAGGPLPHLDAIQASFGGHDVSGIGAHDGPAAAASAAAIGATAYATGDQVAFASAPSLHTAAHEAAHVVQQRAGVQLEGGVGAEGDRYEQHADAVADRVVRGESAEALLDQHAPATAAASSVQRAVQRLATPISAAAPRSAITIRAFIDLVRGEEARWPPAEQTQTALMITRIRKIFYGTAGWDSHLIPGAAGIGSGYEISEEETGRENLSLPGFDADIVRRRQVTRDGAGGTPAIASQQEVRLEDGTFCDVGHVFAGLDAANHPSAVSAPVGLATVSSNLAATTWVGDLGSVVAEAAFAGLNAGNMAIPNATTQAKVDEFAPAQDLLGNIDAYVMDDQYDTTNAAGRRVSDLLSAYYLGAASTPDGQARIHRYSRYARLVGLTGWTGSAFGNEAAWLDTWSPQVGAAAALYIGANTDGIMALPGRGGAVLGIQSAPMVRHVTSTYLNALKAQVAAEPP